MRNDNPLARIHTSPQLHWTRNGHTSMHTLGYYTYVPIDTSIRIPDLCVPQDILDVVEEEEQSASEEVGVLACFVCSN